MKFYVVIQEDRHTDVSVELFEDRDEAIEWARAQAHALSGNWPVTEKVGEDAPGDWLYDVNYGESCDIRVVEEEVHSGPFARLLGY